MSNPTTKHSRDPIPAAAAQQFELIISYSPVEGSLKIGGNVQDSLIFYGILKLAEKTWDRKLDQARARQAVPAIELATALPRPNGGN